MITESLKELDELLHLIKKYSKLGITKVNYHGISIEISPDLVESRHRPKKIAKSSKALATKPDGTDEFTEDEEFKMSQLRIDDPLAFEEYELKRMRGDGRE